MNKLPHLYAKRELWKGPIGTYLPCLLLLFLIPVSLNAQTKLEIGENSTADKTFIATSSEKGKVLVNEKNRVISEHEKNPKSMQRPLGVGFAEPNIINQIFTVELGVRRIQQLLPERFIIVIIYYNGIGKPIAVQFMLNANSQINLEEIERLNNAIKKNVSVAFSSERGIDKSKRFIPIVQAVHFDKLLTN